MTVLRGWGDLVTISKHVEMFAERLEEIETRKRCMHMEIYQGERRNEIYSKFPIL
jgi:hypothetical protein